MNKYQTGGITPTIEEQMRKMWEKGQLGELAQNQPQNKLSHQGAMGIAGNISTGISQAIPGSYDQRTGMMRPNFAKNMLDAKFTTALSAFGPWGTLAGGVIDTAKNIGSFIKHKTQYNKAIKKADMRDDINAYLSGIGQDYTGAARYGMKVEKYPNGGEVMGGTNTPIEQAILGKVLLHKNMDKPMVQRMVDPQAPTLPAGEGKVKTHKMQSGGDYFSANDIQNFLDMKQAGGYDVLGEPFRSTDPMFPSVQLDESGQLKDYGYEGADRAYKNRNVMQVPKQMMKSGFAKTGYKKAAQAMKDEGYTPQYNFGGQAMGQPGMVPVELEQQEVVILPQQGGTYSLYGQTSPMAPSHEQGGVKTALPSGALVFPQKYANSIHTALNNQDWAGIEAMKQQMLQESSQAAMMGAPYSSGGLPMARDGMEVGAALNKAGSLNLTDDDYGDIMRTLEQNLPGATTVDKQANRQAMERGLGRGADKEGVVRVDGVPVVSLPVSETETQQAQTKATTPISTAEGNIPKGSPPVTEAQGALADQQRVLNQLIARDTTGTAPKPLKIDNIMGPNTKGAMDWAASRGLYTPPAAYGQQSQGKVTPAKTPGSYQVPGVYQPNYNREPEKRQDVSPQTQTNWPGLSQQDLMSLQGRRPQNFSGAFDYAGLNHMDLMNMQGKRQQDLSQTLEYPGLSNEDLMSLQQSMNPSTKEQQKSKPPVMEKSKNLPITEQDYQQQLKKINADYQTGWISKQTRDRKVADLNRIPKVLDITIQPQKGTPSLTEQQYYDQRDANIREYIKNPSFDRYWNEQQRLYKAPRNPMFSMQGKEFKGKLPRMYRHGGKVQQYQNGGPVRPTNNLKNPYDLGFGQFGISPVNFISSMQGIDPIQNLAGVDDYATIMEAPTDFSGLKSMGTDIREVTPQEQGFKPTNMLETLNPYDIGAFGIGDPPSPLEGLQGVDSYATISEVPGQEGTPDKAAASDSDMQKLLSGMGGPGAQGALSQPAATAEGVTPPAGEDTTLPTDEQTDKFMPQDYFNLMTGMDIGELVHNWVQPPPPTIQLPRTHLSRMHMDTAPYEAMKEQVRQGGATSFRRLREGLGQASDLMRGTAALSDAQQKQLASIDLSRASAQDQINRQNVEIANQEQQIQDQQKQQGETMNYQIQDAAQKAKDAAISGSIQNLKQDAFNAASFNQAQADIKEQRGIDEQYKRNMEDIQLLATKYAVGKDFQSSDEFVQSQADAMKQHQAQLQDQLREEGFESFTDAEYRAAKGGVAIASREIEAFKELYPEGEAPKREDSPNDQVYAGEKANYDKMKAAADKAQVALGTLQKDVERMDAYTSEVQKRWNLSDQKKAFTEQYRKEKGYMSEAEYIKAIDALIARDRAE